MTLESIISHALERPIPSIAYSVSRELIMHFPGKYILETESPYVNLEEFEAAGHCELDFCKPVHSQVITNWVGDHKAMSQEAVQYLQNVTWSTFELQVLQVSWPERYCNKSVSWIIAESREAAEEFLDSICRWCSEVHGEILVFEMGYWQKSHSLFDSISSTSYDQIVLAGDLKQQIDEDFARFFSSRETYSRYGVPWKRGALFIGPPGNGKTQMVKAIINARKIPCLYAKSFESPHGDEHHNVKQVFERARKSSPCFLVLEDLDSIVNDGNRSYFLNELDGFAANTGIVVLATTNHPERLDPAILDRPSRFDRKYHFNLPGPAERNEYLTMWNRTLEMPLRLTHDGVERTSESTDGFSFAYLKELMLSSIMAWMEHSEPESMDTVIASQVQLLREQMEYRSDELPSVGEDDASGKDQMAAMMQSMQRMGRRGRNR